MTFNFDDVMEALQIVKQCKDTELHIDSGDMQLSICKGKGAGGASGFFNPAGVPGAQKTASPAAMAAPVAETGAGPQAAAAPAPQAAAVVSVATSEEGLVPIRANVTSVFYRKPSPQEPPFVEVGDEVQEDTIICLLEVMKCFRQVMAETRGRIEKICVESNSLVEEGTVMFLIRPQ